MRGASTIIRFLIASLLFAVAFGVGSAEAQVTNALIRNVPWPMPAMSSPIPREGYSTLPSILGLGLAFIRSTPSRALSAHASSAGLHFSSPSRMTTRTSMRISSRLSSGSNSRRYQPTSFLGSLAIEDMQVRPGNADTVALSLRVREAPGAGYLALSEWNADRSVLRWRENSLRSTAPIRSTGSTRRYRPTP